MWGQPASNHMFSLPLGNKDRVHEYASVYPRCWEIESGISYENPSNFIMFNDSRLHCLNGYCFVLCGTLKWCELVVA